MKDLKSAAEARVSELMDQAKKLGFKVPRPSVVFNKRGQVAGTMNFDGTMDLNAELFRQNYDDFLKNTIGHEFAHHICFVYWPNAEMAHGPEWKQIMVQLGLNPSRCHNYDVSTVKVKEYNKFEYKCPVCGESQVLTSIRHNKVRKGWNYLHSKCASAKNPLIFVKELGKISYEAAQNKIQ